MDKIKLKVNTLAKSLEIYDFLRSYKFTFWACPHICKYLKNCTIKWSCRHKEGLYRKYNFCLTMRRREIFLFCPMKENWQFCYLIFCLVLEFIFFKWIWKYIFKYDK
jgi:hypothetical protein